MFFYGKQLDRIERKIDKMPTQADLDTAIDNLLSTIQAKAAQVATDLQNLEAKIAQLEGAPDFSAEIAKIQAGVQAIKDIDPTAANPPAPTPAPAPAPTPTPPPANP
jgi:outer membrane murein-binding lipoprotein Lpp